MIPEHYARDIAIRCEFLINSLIPCVQNGLPGDSRFGGPLTTTFLLAIGAPMVILPIERIFKPARPGSPYVGADERDQDPTLTKAVEQVMGAGRTFGDAAFGRADSWAYVSGYRRFNTAGAWPADLLQSLSEPAASDAARAASAKQILLDLRNALSHGGVAYLDEGGQQTGGEQARMLAFASVGQGSVNVLRIREHHYREFLSAWTRWLEDSGISAALNVTAA